MFRASRPCSASSRFLASAFVGLSVLFSPLRLSAGAGAPTIGRPAPVLAGTASAGVRPLVLTSASALEARKVLDEARLKLRSSLKSGTQASFDDIAASLDNVAARLSDGFMLPGEVSALRAELAELRGMLEQARGGWYGWAEDRFSRLRTSLAPSLDEKRAATAGTLSWVSSNPDSGAQVFDNDRARTSVASVPAPSFQTGTRSSSFSLSAPSAKAKDIDLKVPAPSRTAAAPAPAAPAAPQAGAAAQADPGRKVERASRHVLRLTDPKTGKSVLEVGVADLLRLADAGARTGLSREIAAEVFAALGRGDARLSEALADFLRDIAEYRPGDASAVHLAVDGGNRFSLIFERPDRSRRVLSGQFLPSTGPGGKPGAPAFVVMHPIEVSPAGAASQARFGYWREYLAEGSRHEWTATSETQAKGWGLWAKENQLQKVWLAQQSWTGDKWRETAKENTRTLTVKEGKSWIGKAGDKVMAAPVVGPTLKFCDQVGATLYTGISAAPQVFITAVSGSDTYSLEAAGSYAHNPLMKALVDDQGFLDRLTPGARRDLFAKVRENRREMLESAPFPIAPDLMRQAVDAPIGDREAVATLGQDFGAGSYGKRLVDAGARTEGWQGHALKAGGVATGVFENVAEAVFNPIMWAMMGTGEAAAALKGTQAFAAGAAGARSAYTAVKVSHAVLTAAWWGPWLMSATDNAGRLVQRTSDGKFDKTYYKDVEGLAADLLYLFIIP